MTLVVSRAEQRERIKHRDFGMCTVCDSEESLHLDHIWPRCLGGDDDPANLWLLCASCNLSKADKHPLTWWYSVAGSISDLAIRRAAGNRVLMAIDRAWVLGVYIEPGQK